MIRPRRLAALLATAVLLSGCGGERSSVTSNRETPVVLISIDTLRSDHLPAYGYRAIETPHLDALRRDAILFRRAYSPVPMTLPSHATMLTGLLPADHGVRNNIGFHFDSTKEGSLPCVLRNHGILSGAAVSSYVLRAGSGMDSCFDDYDDSIDPHPGAAFGEYQRSGYETLRAAESWIDAHQSKPFFYFFHLYEPHLPYTAPEPFKSRYSSGYDAEIATADDIVGKLLDHLRSLGIYDRALVIVTSDHGEGLGDHGEEQHSILLYREALQVPLFVKLPNRTRAGTTVDAPVQLSDLYPTVLTLLGIEPPHRADGISLLESESKLASRSIFAETMYPRIHLGWSDLASLIRDQHHYIDGPRPELYDLSSDPAEKDDILDANRRIAASMRKEIEPYRKPLRPMENVDPEVMSRLAALGYIGSPKVSDLSSSLPNPADRIQYLDRIRNALLLAEEGRFDDSVAGLRELVAENPGMVEVWTRLAEVLAKAGREKEAAEAYREAFARSPIVSSDDLVRAGYVHLRLGELDQAERLAGSAMRENPGKAHELNARIALTRKDLVGAEREARATIAATREQPSSLLLLAEVQQRAGHFDAALATISTVEARGRDLGMKRVYGLEFLRADTFARMQRMPEAEESYRREIEAFPAHLDAYVRLAIVYAVEGKSDSVEPLFEKMLRANPSAATAELAAKTLETLEDVAGARRWRSRARSMRRSETPSTPARRSQ
ncbi:MAG: sulfatase-like hydrolase/transferase [Thermoanaerobaculia bacterium]